MLVEQFTAREQLDACQFRRCLLFRGLRRCQRPFSVTVGEMKRLPGEETCQLN
jgi:hypothetical protein